MNTNSKTESNIIRERMASIPDTIPGVHHDIDPYATRVLEDSYRYYFNKIFEDHFQSARAYHLNFELLKILIPRK